MKHIGNTPLIRLRRLPGPDCAEVYVKWEGANPTGSMKDRMALSMIEGAERRGQLRPGATVVEYTGGSTGSALAMVCAAKGYRAHLVSSDAFAEEKLRTMRAFGATVEVIPSGDGKATAELFQKMIARAKELSWQPDTFWTDQLNNADNRAAYHAMGREILAALDGKVDEFITAVGSGGSLSGTAEILNQGVPGVHCLAIEPEHSRALAGLAPTGGHRLEGIGVGFVPSICRTDLIDEVIAVSDRDAFETARRLAQTEGIFGGITSGANVWAALRRARSLGPGHRVVTLIIDSGLKYLDGDLFRPDPVAREGDRV